MAKIVQILTQNPTQPYVLQVKPVNQVTELVKILQTINVTKPEAKLNESTISDGKGGRIELNNDKIISNDFEK